MRWGYARDLGKTQVLGDEEMSPIEIEEPATSVTRLGASSGSALSRPSQKGSDCVLHHWNWNRCFTPGDTALGQTLGDLEDDRSQDGRYCDGLQL